MRKFEKVSRVKDIDFKLPERATKYSAGYDFYNPEEITILPKSIVYVRTGIKAKMPDDEVLMLYNRSSNPKKKGLITINSVGVIDSDFYNNEKNEGEISFAFQNITNKPVTLECNEKLGQGIFTKYYITDDDNTDGTRQGGFGSTGR